jgi:hypothetical protein
MFDRITEALCRKPVVSWNPSESYQKGIDTHGCNTLSKNRGQAITNCTLHYKPFGKTLHEIIPEDVADRLAELRDKDVTIRDYGVGPNT